MATQELTPSSHETRSEARRRACLQAACELESIALAAIPHFEGIDAELLFLRGAFLRVRDLSGLLIDGLDDDSVSTESLEQMLHGQSQRAGACPCSSSRLGSETEDIAACAASAADLLRIALRVLPETPDCADGCTLIETAINAHLEEAARLWKAAQSADSNE